MVPPEDQNDPAKMDAARAALEFKESYDFKLGQDNFIRHRSPSEEDGKAQQIHRQLPQY